MDSYGADNFIESKSGIGCGADIAGVVEDWQKKLLQLDRRNRLLYFKPGRTAVMIDEHTPDSIAKALSRARRGLKFDFVETRRRKGADDNDWDAMVPGDIRGDCPTAELQRRLTNLRKRAREWQEEQGLNILSVALGMLHWIDKDREEAVSPLLLLPAQLDKVSPSEPFVLSEDDDDIAGNPTLSEKLRLDFGLELPPFDGNGDAGDYLRKVRSLVESRSGWRVEESVYLSVFAYSKLAMWQDLERVRRNGTSHPIVRRLSGDKSPARMESENIPRAVLVEKMEGQVAGGLDDLLNVREQNAVMEADYSQLIALEAAKSGANLVIHGPPGTGKSQTIANIISATIAAGKTVLFVSEKTAALDVVKRRMDDVGLGVFCLDLHSERGSKTSVYEQLRQSVNDARQVSPGQFDYEAHAALRDELNRTVRALHDARQPLGESVFTMHGRFAELRDKPHAAFEVEDIGAMTSRQFAAILSAAGRIAQHPAEYREHHTSVWRALRPMTQFLELANIVRDDMASLIAAVNRLADDTAGIGEGLGLGKPRSRGQVARTRNIASHLSSAPGVPAKWLTLKARKGLQKIAKEDADSQRARQGLLERLAPYFGEDLPDWDFESLSKLMELEPREAQLLRKLLGRDYSALLARPGLGAFREMESLNASIGELRSAASEFAAFMNLDAPATLAEIAELTATAYKAAELNPVPEPLLAPGAQQRVRIAVDDARRLANDLTEKERILFSMFEEAMLESVDLRMVTRYRTDHQSGVRRLFSGSYKRDRNLLRGAKVSAGKLSFEDERGYVELAARINGLRAEWEAGEDALWQLFGRLYQRRNTDWNGLIKYASDVWELVGDWRGSRVPLAILTDQRQRGTCETKAANVDRLLRRTREHMAALGLHEQANGASDSSLNLSELSELLNLCGPTLNRLRSAIEAPSQVALRRIDNLETLASLLKCGKSVREMEREQESTADARRADFGARYAGFDTDWSNVSEALEWVGKLQSLLERGRASDALARHCAEPMEPERYGDMAASLERAVSSFDTAIRSLEERFDFAVGRWSEWDDALFEQIIEWASDLSERADGAGDWLIYRAAVRELETAISEGAFDAIYAVAPSAEDAPGVVERRITSAWLDWAYSEEPALANFTSARQDDSRAKFKQLDEFLPVAARNEVRRRIFEEMPNTASASTAAGQLGTLNHELNKRRRQLPVKQLIERIPLLIGAIKPCFMMSPLAVSQYLPISDLESETLGFDVVIFDEASQVFPEDAIPAILRGKQIVLAGDQKQLPPTHFFRSGAGDSDDFADDEYEEQPDQLADMESILDAAIGQSGSLFAEAHLNVHYRSRDERLIQFSNRHFYDDRLFTFPSPRHGNGWLGMNDVYVEDGVFESRVNEAEAERVADLVFEHMRCRPSDESVGVVAMSRTQADLISQIIDDRRLDERGHDARFADDVTEPFFVKNLENVQGDERDHMILSVGYGPNRQGRTFNRFGPINAQGGQRRLNVAITRAKLRLSTVHSLKPSDITATSQGARLLRSFLEYSANPNMATQDETAEDDGVEFDAHAPFEETVGRALEARGHRIERQVGIGGHRIDLAILAEDGPGMDLGIECDGAAYHSSPSARDRDWLRQRVLEGLGWRVHRVWSTSWVRNPEGEIAAIEAALEEARKSPPLPSTPVQPSPIAPQPESVNAPVGGGVEVPARDSAEFDEYVKADLNAFPPSNLLTLQIIRVAEVEGPVHIEIVIKRIFDRRGDLQGREWIKSVIASEVANEHIRSRDDFVWTSDEQLTRRPRKPGSDGERRTIDQISKDELRMAVLATVRQMYGGSQSEVVSQTARNLGYQRTGSLIGRRLNEVIDDMLNDGELERSFGSIVAQ